MRLGLDGALVHFGLWRDDDALVRCDFIAWRGGVRCCFFGRVAEASPDVLRLVDAPTGMELRLVLSEVLDFWFEDMRGLDIAAKYTDGITVVFPSAGDDPDMADKIVLSVFRKHDSTSTH